jgi:hypothetical protein
MYKHLSAMVLLSIVASNHARAEINVMDHSDVMQVISVRNNSSQPVTFTRTANTCVYDSPASFTVAANSSTTIQAKNKWWDTGLDNCYATQHVIAYQDAANAGNTFSVQQFNNSSLLACLDIKYNIIFWIHQAICPLATGSVFAPTNSDSNSNGLNCPADAEHCPPTDNNSNTQWFGFAIEKPDDFSVVIDNDTQSSLDCLLTDLNRKTDRNACTQVMTTVGASKSSITLPGLCGSIYYRAADRVNVQLLCYVSGSNYVKTKSWSEVKSNTTYVYNSSVIPVHGVKPLATAKAK